MELQSLVGLGQEFVHCVREALVVFIVHPLPLPCLRENEGEKQRQRVTKRAKESEMEKGREGRKKERVGGELITNILLD